VSYSTAVLERVRHPQRVGSLRSDEAGVGTGEAGSLDEGTVARIQVRVANERIAEARFKVFGCSAAIASASLVAEWLEGANPDDAARVTPESVATALALPDERRYVAAIAVTAAERAIADWRRKAASEGPAGTDR
jgi:nitrogen fixation NifU-like protein